MARPMATLPSAQDPGHVLDHIHKALMLADSSDCGQLATAQRQRDAAAVPRAPLPQRGHPRPHTFLHTCAPWAPRVPSPWQPVPDGLGLGKVVGTGWLLRGPSQAALQEGTPFRGDHSIRGPSVSLPQCRTLNPHHPSDGHHRAIHLATAAPSSLVTHTLLIPTHQPLHPHPTLNTVHLGAGVRGSAVEELFSPVHVYPATTGQPGTAPES